MGVSRDMFRAWIRPRRVMATRLGEGLREDRALIFLMVACLLIFVAQWPRLVREFNIDPGTPLDARLGGALFGWIFVAPLSLYVLAGLSHLIARVFGGRGSWFGARLALFWSLLAATPAWLLNGLIGGYVATGYLQAIVGGIALAGFVWIWLSSLIESEWAGEPS